VLRSDKKGGALFYLRSDGQYRHQLKYIVHLVLNRKERPLSIRNSQSIIVNKNTAIIASLSKIYCASDLKKKRTLKPDGQYILADDDGTAVFLFIVIMLSVMIDSGRSFLLKAR
jgi:hypothetical protein